MVKRMVLNETSYFGAGAIEVIPEEMTRRGFSKAFVVTDKDLVAAGSCLLGAKAPQTPQHP